MVLNFFQHRSRVTRDGSGTATLEEVEATDVYSRLGSRLASLAAHSLHGVKQTQTASGWRQLCRGDQGSIAAANRQIICVNCEEAMEKAFPSSPTYGSFRRKNVVNVLVVFFFLHLFFSTMALCVPSTK